MISVLQLINDVQINNMISVRHQITGEDAGLGGSTEVGDINNYATMYTHCTDSVISVRQLMNHVQIVKTDVFAGEDAGVL